MNIKANNIFRLQDAIFAWLFTLISIPLIYAQESPPSLDLTFEKARSLGLSNSKTLQAKTLDIKISEEQIRLVQKESLPSINTDANVQRNLILPVTPVPARAFNPDAPEDELTLLKFTTKWSGNAGINLDYPLFNPEQKSRVRQQKIQSEIAETEIKIEEADILLNVSNAYVAALIAKEQLELGHADVRAKQRILEMLTEQYEAGRIKLPELNIGKADVNNAVSKQKDAQNIFSKAKAELLYYIGYRPEDTIEMNFEDDLETLFHSLNTLSIDEKTNLNQLKLQQQKKLLEEEMIAVRAKYLPQLNLGAFLGTNYFDNNFDVFKDQNWHGNSFVRLGIRIPLTDWTYHEHERKTLDLQIKSNELFHQEEKEQASLRYFNILQDKELYKEKYAEMKENFSLEQENYELAQQQYKEGRLLISDLQQADYLVQIAKNEYLNAVYNYLEAEIKLENERKK